MAFNYDYEPAAKERAGGTGSVKGALARYTDSVSAYLQAALQLAGDEARLTALSLLELAGTALVMAVLVVSAWLCLLGALCFAAVSLGLPPGIAMLLAALLNGALILWLLKRSKTLAGNLGFRNTLSLLNSGPMADNAGTGREPPGPGKMPTEE